MKTTIEIPDELAREAKSVAQQAGTTLRDLVVAGLREQVARRARAPRVDFAFPTVGGRGLVAEVSPSEVVARSYDMTP